MDGRAGETGDVFYVTAVPYCPQKMSLCPWEAALRGQTHLSDRIYRDVVWPDPEEPGRRPSALRLPTNTSPTARFHTKPTMDLISPPHSAPDTTSAASTRLSTEIKWLIDCDRTEASKLWTCGGSHLQMSSKQQTAPVETRTVREAEEQEEEPINCEQPFSSFCRWILAALPLHDARPPATPRCA
ncbi:unnamed protein product [Pleuronectes platessa]|uniref:Uncharacterized protein n=1 Tax=Pleuronectes platessa TaxID=8262 RepID=A0A9N7W1M7_PLEPL|nr:unnamed protein product [Pleuronectes platessa]